MNSGGGMRMRNHTDDDDDDIELPSVIELQPLKLLVKDNDNEHNEEQQERHTSSSTQTTQPFVFSFLSDLLYPPDLPRSCQLLRIENLAIPACYLLVGLLQGLSGPLLVNLPLDLGATEAQQTTLSSIRSLPASFKLLFGFVSDTLPILGQRRKPYMLIGWCLASVSLLALWVGTDLKIAPRNAGCFQGGSTSNTATLTTTTTLPPNAPSIAILSLALLGFGTGFWLADVMGDSMVAEKAKLEPEHARGSVQSMCYSYRFFGIVVAAPLSTYLYAKMGPASVVAVLSVLPLCILPLVYLLEETPCLQIKSTREQCGEIWNTVSSRAVWQPMGFVYVYNLLQVGNAAWREFLTTVLHFTSCQLNLILITAYLLLYLGILSYKYWFIQWSWRKVYVVTTLLNGFFSLLQVLLVQGKTLGLSPFIFALGDDAFAEFIQGIQFLPTTIMMVHLCPDGSEGASYAMFTTVNNSALTLSSAFSTMMLGIWDVSRSALQAGNLTGMINLTYLTTALQVSGLAFVGLLPRYKDDLMRLQHEAKSTIGGSIFLAVTFLSILYAVTVGVLNIVAPGWMGES